MHIDRELQHRIINIGLIWGYAPMNGIESLKPPRPGFQIFHDFEQTVRHLQASNIGSL